MLKHALRNALVPIVTVLGLTAALMIGGAVVTETVFGLPGVGSLVVNAVLRRDYPVIQGALLVIARARGVTMAQVALAWLLGREMVSSVILGARTVEQLQENLGAAELRLTGEEATRLDAVSDPAPADYPYGGPGVEQRSRRLEGIGSV